MPAFPIPAIEIVIDHAQKRIQNGLQTVLAHGSFEGTDGKRVPGWDPVLQAGVYQCPVTFNLMNRPRIFDGAFYETNTGVYQKLGVGDFTGAAAAGWVVNDKSGVGGLPFLTNDAGSAALVSSSALGENQGFMVAVFNYSDGSSRQELLRFGISNTGDLTAGVGFVWFNDNTVDIYKGGDLVATGSVASKENGGETRANQWTGLAVIPQRKREVLMLSIPTGGGAFVHAFDDIDEDDSTPVILPAEKIWFEKVSGLPDVLVYPMRYYTAGQALSKRLAFARAPETGQTSAATVYGWFHGVAQTVELLEDPSTTFVANGTRVNARIKVTLNGSATKTPSLYGSSVAFGTTYVDTDDAPLVITPYVPSGQISFGETADSVVVGLDIARPETLEDELSTTGIRDSQFRPIRLDAVTDAGAVPFIEGQIEVDHVASGKYADADRVVITTKDWWHRLEDFRFRDPLPLDGFAFEDAIGNLVQLVGEAPGGAPVISATTLTLPDLSPPTAGEWSALIRAGDTIAEWVNRLFQTYAPNWLYGFFPTSAGVRFKAISPADLPTTAKAVLYQTHELALAALIADGVPSNLAQKQAANRLYSKMVRRRRPPVATEVNVTGLNGRTGEPEFAAVKIDINAENPATPLGSRPANWVGNKLVFGYADGLLNSQALVDACTDAYFDLVTQPRDIVQWEGQMLFDDDGVPLWRGDVVELDGTGFFRLTSMRARLVLRGDGGVGVPSPGDRFEDWVNIPATYTAEKIGEDIPAGFRGDCPEDGIEPIMRWPFVQHVVRPRGVGKAVNLLQQNARAVTQTKVT